MENVRHQYKFIDDVHMLHTCMYEILYMHSIYMGIQIGCKVTHNTSLRSQNGQCMHNAMLVS